MAVPMRPHLRRPRRLAAAGIAVLVVTVAGVTVMHVVDRTSPSGYSLDCHAASAELDLAGLYAATTCTPVLVSLGPGRYHIASSFAQCNGTQVSLNSTSTTDAHQAIHLVVGATGAPADGLAGARPALSTVDVILSRPRALVLEGTGGVVGDNSHCTAQVTITRTDDVPPVSPQPVRLHCTTADTPGAGGPAYDPQSRSWKAPAIHCASTAVLAPGDYHSVATLSDCGAGVRWMLTPTDQSPAWRTAVVVGQDRTTTTAPDGISPEHTTPYETGFSTFQPSTFALSRGAQPEGARYDNSLCGISLTITPTTSQEAVATTSAGPALQGTPPADEGAFTWQVDGTRSVTATLHTGTWRLDTGMSAASCAWHVDMPGIAGGTVDHAAHPGAFGTDGLSSAPLFVAQTGQYRLLMHSDCAVPVSLTYLGRQPQRTGMAAAG